MSVFAKLANESTDTWSLQSDTVLATCLSDLSVSINERSSSLFDKIAEANKLTHETHTRMHNVVNEFAILANTQFIENRVYEEDVSDTEGGADEGAGGYT